MKRFSATIVFLIFTIDLKYNPGSSPPKCDPNEINSISSYNLLLISENNSINFIIF